MGMSLRAAAIVLPQTGLMVGVLLQKIQGSGHIWSSGEGHECGGGPSGSCPS